MEFMDAISLTISSMLIVFLTLFIISLMLQSFDKIFKPEMPKQPVPVANAAPVAPVQTALDFTEEERTVVAVMASILAGEDSDNPNLHIKDVKRIR